MLSLLYTCFRCNIFCYEFIILLYNAIFNSIDNYCLLFLLLRNGGRGIFLWGSPTVSHVSTCDSDKMADETKPVATPIPKPRPRKGIRTQSTGSVETNVSASVHRARSTSENTEYGMFCHIHVLYTYTSLWFCPFPVSWSAYLCCHIIYMYICVRWPWCASWRSEIE